jgi:hypothetical protein
MAATEQMDVPAPNLWDKYFDEMHGAGRGKWMFVIERSVHYLVMVKQCSVNGTIFSSIF